MWILILMACKGADPDARPKADIDALVRTVLRLRWSSSLEGRARVGYGPTGDEAFTP